MAASKTPPTKQRRNRQAGVKALHFHGESDSPETLEKVLDRRPTPGNPEAAPDEVVRARTERTLWLPPPAKGKRGSRIQVSDPDVEHGYQRLTIDLTGHDGLHLPGRTAERQRPEGLIRDVNPEVLSGAYRPDWIGANILSSACSTCRHVGIAAPYERSIGDPPICLRSGRSTCGWRPELIWGLVGKIFTSDGFTGTGALIGPRLVATAWNTWSRGESQGGGCASFQPSTTGRRYTAQVSSRTCPTQKAMTSMAPSRATTGRCFVSISHSAPGWATSGTTGSSLSWLNKPYWTLLGYPGGVANGQRPSYQAGYSMFDIDSDSNGGAELETQADATPGNSGGPSFGWWNGDPRLVGVVSGDQDWTPGGWPWEWADTTKGNVVAGGAGFTNLMAWGRTNWP